MKLAVTIVKRSFNGVSLRRLKRIISINSGGGRDTENDRFRVIQRPVASRRKEKLESRGRFVAVGKEGERWRFVETKRFHRLRTLSNGRLITIRFEIRRDSRWDRTAEKTVKQREPL